MARVRQAGADGLYGRVLQRLGHALSEAERHSEAEDAELEVRGLSSAELALIRAYLDHDDRWLSGWHAAAEEHALIERQAGRPSLRARAGLRTRHSGQPQRSLSCAVCGSDVHWPDGPGALTCASCGSHLLRGRQRFGLRRH